MKLMRKILCISLSLFILVQYFPIFIGNASSGLRFDNADILDVLQALARASQMNIMVDKSVQGRITLDLQDISLSEAIYLVTKTAGFSYRIVEDVLIVGTEENLKNAFDVEKIEVFPITYGDIEEINLLVQTIVVPSEIQVHKSRNALVVRGTEEQLNRVRALLFEIDLPQSGIIQEVEVYAIEHVSVNDVKDLIELVLDSVEIHIDASNNILIVRGTPGELATVASLVDKADKPKSADEVGIFLVNHADVNDVKRLLELLVDASQVQINSKKNTVIVRGSLKEIEAVESFIEKIDQPEPLVLIEARVQEVSVSALDELGIRWTLPILKGEGAFGTSFLWEPWQIRSTLDALETKGESALLANPSITTLDGATARIFIGDRIPIVLRGESDDAIKYEKIEYIDAGIILEITPRISKDRTIIFEVDSRVSTIAEWTPQQFPQIRTREAQTTARVNDGEPIVIGGLIKSEDFENMSKIPILGNLPIIGALFKTKKIETKKTETVIFITPHIIEPAAKSIQNQL